MAHFWLPTGIDDLPAFSISTRKCFILFFIIWTRLFLEKNRKFLLEKQTSFFRFVREWDFLAFRFSLLVHALEQIICLLWIKVAIFGRCDPFLSLSNPVNLISASSPG